jgi:hypothetical protein
VTESVATSRGGCTIRSLERLDAEEAGPALVHDVAALVDRLKRPRQKLSTFKCVGRMLISKRER